MKLLKPLRNPKIALFLPLLILFVSCSKEGITIESKSKNLELTIKKHIELSKILSSIILAEPNLNKINFDKKQQFYKSDSEYKNSLTKQGFANADEIISISEEIKMNLTDYMNSKKYNKNNISINEMNDLFSKEIIRQIEGNKIEFLSKSSAGPCEDANEVATENCGENFYIGTSVGVVIGFFTFGIGTVVGVVTSSALMVKCTDDAYDAYQTCIGNTAKL